MAYETILLERRGSVGLITLNRPRVMNAINAALVAELAQAVDELEADAKIAAIVIAGSERVFAAGADVTELRALTFPDTYLRDVFARIDRLAEARKPTIAAVAGYVLGGGCELAMACDMIIAAENAKFGLPEVSLGIIPGFGGTQRLTRLVGKAKAMDLILTGRMMDANEAERSGLVSRVVPADDLLDEAIKAAGKIASLSRPVAMMAKEAVNRAYETTLSEGIRAERRLFQATFATEDQKEGMAAFVEKRAPQFHNR
ncbi:MAG: enoyl-CoA hydratase [Bauldia sp.]|nr:enoyl-CoA hydratase [Bauldia sp.]